MSGWFLQTKLDKAKIPKYPSATEYISDAEKGLSFFSFKHAGFIILIN